MKKTEIILDKIGEPAAWEQLAEECTELAKEALKVARIMRFENPTPVPYEEAFGNVVEELTDVIICCEVLGIVKTQEYVDRQKVDRWLGRLEAAGL